MSPTPRAAAALAAIALAAVVVGGTLALVAAGALLVAVAMDAWAARAAPAITRRAPAILARGVPARLHLAAQSAPGTHVLLRQPLPPDLEAAPQEGRELLEAELVGRRRGRHVLDPPATRTVGPLGLGRCDHRPGEPEELLVYPDYPAARRLALAVRQGRLRDSGRLRRGPLGLGTDFESIRDYLPDDDVRQVNWAASERMQRPMSNQYRLEQDRDVVLAVDAGRLMASPIDGATRLDVAIDAATAVALVADAVGDRCGVVAFDRAVRRHLRPRRAGGEGVVRALFDLEPSADEPDYELAFRTVEGGKRSLVVVFCDLVEEVAARSLLDAVPVLARRHAVLVVTSTDPDLAGQLTSAPDTPAEAYATAVVLDVIGARNRVIASLQRSGARVAEALPGSLSAAAVSAYLRLKAQARL